MKSIHCTRSNQDKQRLRSGFDCSVGVGRTSGHYFDRPTVMQNQGILVGRQVACEVIREIARENAYHPIIDVFRRLGWPANSIWDGEPRIGTWLSKYLGVHNNVETRALGAAWLMSMVQRILDPGCSVPGVLVLTGNAPGKSEALRILAGDFFADIETGAENLKGIWVAEIDPDRVRSLAKIRGLKGFVARRTPVSGPVGRWPARPATRAEKNAGIPFELA